MFIKDSAFKMIIEERKMKDLFDIKSIEFLVSCISAFVISIVFIMLLYQIDILEINELIRELSKNIGVALISLLGFVVSGLAILTSAVSNKVINIIYSQDKMRNLTRIFLSFYLLGLLIGVSIINLFGAFIISYINIPIKLFIVAPWIFISSYVFIFIIFYAIALIGNCIQIFTIINDYEINYLHKSNELTEEEITLYNSFKLSALEIIFLTTECNEINTPIKKLKRFLELMNSFIDSDCKSESQKIKLSRHLSAIYMNKEEL